MSLLSTDITKVKRLSLSEVKLPTSEQRIELITKIKVERPPTDEQKKYNRLILINPIIEDLVNTFNLLIPSY